METFLDALPIPDFYVMMDMGLDVSAFERTGFKFELITLLAPLHRLGE